MTKVLHILKSERDEHVAEITVCDASLQKRSAEFNRRIPDTVTLVAPKDLAAIFNSWARHVVF